MQGRFISPDDFLNDSHASDPQSWNLYNYVRNNPLRYIDPDGRIKRDEKGNIIFDVAQTNVTRTYVTAQLVATDQNGNRTNVTLTITGQVDAGYIYADDGTAIVADRSSGPLTATITDANGNSLYQGGVDGLPTINGQSFAGFNNTTDCHGNTFADGKLWINNDQVGALMRGDGYVVNDAGRRPRPGDVGIYSTDGSLNQQSVQHSVIVTKVDCQTGTVTEVESKAGITRREITTPGPGPRTAWEPANVRLNYYNKRLPTPTERLKAFIEKQRIY